MEMSQGNFWYSYLKPKCHFFYNNNGELDGRTGPISGLVPGGGWKMWGGDVGW
jgi:hypothetical protein